MWRVKDREEARMLEQLGGQWWCLLTGNVEEKLVWGEKSKGLFYRFEIPERHSGRDIECIEQNISFWNSKERSGPQLYLLWGNQVRGTVCLYVLYVFAENSTDFKKRQVKNCSQPMKIAGLKGKVENHCHPVYLLFSQRYKMYNIIFILIFSHLEEDLEFYNAIRFL